MSAVSVPTAELVDSLRQSAIVADFSGTTGLRRDEATVDSLSVLYNTELTAVADTLAPQRLVTIRPRRSDPWFDPECRAAKRL